MLLLVLPLLLVVSSSAVAWVALGAFCKTPLELPWLVADIAFTVLQTSLAVVRRGGRPLFPEWTLPLEFVQSVARCVMVKYGANVVEEANAQKFGYVVDRLGKWSGGYACRAFGTTLHAVTVNGLEHFWVRADQTVDAKDKYVVLYVHGGGYTILTPSIYIILANRLRHAIAGALRPAASIQLDVFLANYRKAPGVRYPTPQQDVLLTFEYLRDHEGISPSKIILAGDSAGGGLVLSTLLRLRDQKKELPLASILLFPLCDLTDDGASDPTRGQHCILSHAFLHASRDALLPASMDPSSYKDTSAVDCDLRGLPPALVPVGTNDFLYRQSLKLIKKADADGVAGWELAEYTNMPHVFTTFPTAVAPASANAFQRMGEFVAKQIGACAKSE